MSFGQYSPAKVSTFDRTSDVCFQYLSVEAKGSTLVSCLFSQNVNCGSTSNDQTLQRSYRSQHTFIEGVEAQNWH